MKKKNKLAIKAEEPSRNPKFKSKLEEKIWKSLPTRRTKYESVKIKYSQDREYILDFIVDRKDHAPLLLEVKGYFRPQDRSKMLAVKAANPELDIRFIFAADNKISKRSNTRYSDWCKKHGFKYAIGKVPYHWLYPQEYDSKYSKSWYARNRERHIENTRRSKIKREYGLSEEDYKKLIETQRNCCAICGTDFDSLPRKPDIDHDHKTGKVRGLLCWTCNGGLGQFNDDSKLLKSAINYLESSKIGVYINKT